MGKKIDLRAEKLLRNEEYADRFRKARVEDDTRKAVARKGGKFGKWCRVATHPPTCSCNY